MDCSSRDARIETIREGALREWSEFSFIDHSRFIRDTSFFSIQFSLIIITFQRYHHWTALDRNIFSFTEWISYHRKCSDLTRFRRVPISSRILTPKFIQFLPLCDKIFNRLCLREWIGWHMYSSGLPYDNIKIIKMVPRISDLINNSESEIHGSVHDHLYDWGHLWNRIEYIRQ
jgi:hypothetical protein